MVTTERLNNIEGNTNTSATKSATGVTGLETIPFSRADSGLEGKDLTEFKSSEHLVHVLKDSGRPAFLFGSTPPREGTTEVRMEQYV